MIAPPGPEHDVVIVGGGPGGSATALLLARLGRRVLVVDRATFPRPKPCGECVNPGAVGILDRLGLLASVRALNPAPLDGWRVACEEGPLATGSFGSASPGGLGVPRAAFDHALLKRAVAAGAALREGVRAVGVTPHPTRPRVTVLDPRGRRQELRARVVVAADGLRSVVARRAGLVEPVREPRKASATFRVRGTGPPRKRGLLYLGRGFTVGLAPVAAREPLWNMTVVVDPVRFGSELARDPAGLLLDLAAAAPIAWDSEPAPVAGPWTSGPFHQPSRGAGAPGIVAVGDAAGYFDPLTGQGIHRALRSAELAAPAVELALRDPRRSGPVLRRYGRSLRRALAPGRGLQKLIEGALSRSSLRAGALRGLGRAPEAFDALIRVTGDSAPLWSLARPRLWLEVLASTEARRRGALES